MFLVCVFLRNKIKYTRISRTQHFRLNTQTISRKQYCRLNGQNYISLVHMHCFRVVKRRAQLSAAQRRYCMYTCARWHMACARCVHYMGMHTNVCLARVAVVMCTCTWSSSAACMHALIFCQRQVMELNEMTCEELAIHLRENGIEEEIVSRFKGKHLS